MPPLSSISTRIFQGAFLLLALFVPFSIAGTNIALGFATLAWILWLVVERGPRIRFDTLALASIALVLFALPSVLMSENISRALNDWRSYWQLAICFLVGGHIARVRVREHAYVVLLVSSAISCLVAFVQRGGGIHLGPIHIGAEHRVSSTLFTMTFAGILYQLIAFNAAAALSPRMARLRWWIAAAASAQFVALMFTMTRGAWIAVFAGLLTVCVLLRSRALAFAGAIAFAVILVFSIVYKNDQGRTIAVTSFATEQADRNVTTRLVLWDMSWHMFLDHPVLGVGMGDYSIEAEKRLASRHVRTTVDSHNVFLQVLATRGLVGFIPLAAWFVVLIASLWAIARSAPPGSIERHYAIGAIGVTAAVLVGAMTENNVDDGEVMIAFMFLVGMARAGRQAAAARA